ncbi:M14 family zinc carboxypeptidase [Streptomyces sp. NBC_01716]|uniref:M14 family zinc carboxypeptidase n=1 Tax=Streptomyces sp. NBC_01716 TaxID=2975917 RepID=UPI002E302BEE|nr:M14 family zinc carboxypeptidase [Streptomyces sp. NBC_01716]
MGMPRPVLLATATATAALMLSPLPATAVPGAGGDRSSHPVRDGGATDSRVASSALPSAGAAALSSVGTTSPGLRKEGGYPRRTVLDTVPENPADKAIKLGLAPYHSLAPRLNALQELGNRVSVEVTGRSAAGHDLYLVTVTAPESAKEVAEQERMRERIESSPASAAKDRRIKESYKTPVFINNNIHGNEWEGTDAALKLIEELAKAKDGDTRKLLATSRIHLNVTANPDGRIAGTRANGNGLDLNRDFITASQPEARAIRQIAVDKQPAVMLDLHGYVNGTLIEPTTPPHGENYEYDLFLKNSYANALGMEKAVNDLGYTAGRDGVQPPVIPFRDQEEGWDDWPPIFTPQYMAFQGAVASHTVEIPMRVNNNDYNNLPVEELRRRSGINTAVAGAAMRSTLDFARENRETLIADQIETFRRGVAGEKQRVISEETVPGVPGIGPEDIYTTDFPRAYVIPAGGGQRSAPAAARLVDHLVANDVRVEQARKSFKLAGRTYPAGSYVVDMKQAKRGIANVILSEGRDISADVSSMYDISGWSLGLLWGADVTKVQRGQLDFAGRAVTAASPVGSVARGGDLKLRLDDPKEFAAVNSLLAQGVKVRRTADGAAIVPSSARRKAEILADRYGVVFTATKDKGVAALRRTTVAAAVNSGELFALREMGFEVLPVSTATANGGFDWSKADALYVSTGLSHAGLNDSARAALAEFLAGGAPVVALGSGGAAFNAEAALLTATPVRGNGSANGVVRVVNTPGPVTGGTQPHSFVYSPLWFTGLGKGVRTEQSYGGGNPLVSGHWRADESGAGGPQAAAGQAAIVSGTSAAGTPVTLFGTEPLFRDHPKGAFAQVGRALLNRLP